VSRPSHTPCGDPCLFCGSPRLSHRVEHTPDGDPCKRCKLPRENHRKRETRPDPRAYHLPLGDPCHKCGKAAIEHRTHEDRKRETFIGIDGEGQGRLEHRYVMLAAADRDNEKQWCVEAPENGRLSTVECLDFILKLPARHARIFSFSFNYDLTKMLQDVDDRTLYRLFRPELRPRRHVALGDPCALCGKTPDEHLIKQNIKEMIRGGPIAESWNGYRLNLQGTKFTVERGAKKIVIWDLFKFFQAKFVSAIRDWKVGDDVIWKRIETMKDKRSEFDKESRAAVREYCFEECRLMADLAHKLLDAHERVGLKLKAFYGAGSSGGAMLSLMGIREKIRPCMPEMKVPVAQAFFGGRFENSVVGAIREPLDGWDISSAYPYHIAFLPCLEHGFWKYTKRESDLEHTRFALVRYTLDALSEKQVRNMSWGPFPFRLNNGTSCYPAVSGGGWVWRDEFRQGKKLFPHVRFREAWTYDCQCECQPFAQIPLFYLERLRIGKEGPGIVLKLGCNSCYGKLAQSVGNAQFNSWIWAGIITSGTRAQILEMLGLHEDRSNMLMVATDGIYTREKLIPPLPRDTGTYHAKNSKGDKCPLGGWENKAAPRGVFFARPGIYFPINPTKEEIKDIRGRGVGKSVVLEHWESIVEAYEKGLPTVQVTNVQRFCGAKTSISRSREGYNRANHEAVWDGERWVRDKPAFGEWIARPVDMSFNPMPKRECVKKDGVSLQVRAFSIDKVSEPYSRALVLKDPEVQAMIAFQREIEEQPDADLHEVGLGEA
jgi:hypothetical protein